MPNFPDHELEWMMSDLDEHASTLRALGERLSATDPDATRTTQAIAHELWEIRKALGDGRRPVEKTGEDLCWINPHHKEADGNA